MTTTQELGDWLLRACLGEPGRFRNLVTHSTKKQDTFCEAKRFTPLAVMANLWIHESSSAGRSFDDYLKCLQQVKAFL